MILAVDVHYDGAGATTSGVAFADWGDAEPVAVYASRRDDVVDYVPGEFFRRELPCLLGLLQEHRLRPRLIVIDGYVFLDGVARPGLGMHLHDALGGSVPVVGVAKTAFAGIGDGFAVRRGGSTRPLYVTAVGIDLAAAQAGVRAMHGAHRLPTLLQLADRRCRAGQARAATGGAAD